MLGKLTQETLAMVGRLGQLTQDTIDRFKRMTQSSEREVGYRGYGIRATPKPLRDTGEWTLEVHISRDRGGERREQLCSARDTFKTRDEAVVRGVQFGRDIIDGRVPGCSVAAL